MTSYLTAPLSGEAPRPFEELVEEALNALPPTFPRDIAQVMIALDIDGTILSPSGASTRVVESIAALSRASAQVVIATGRTMGAVLPVLPLLGFRRGWIVASNGAVLARVHEAGYEVVHRHELLCGRLAVPQDAIATPALVAQGIAWELEHGIMRPDVLLLNQCDTPRDHALASQLARELTALLKDRSMPVCTTCLPARGARRDRGRQTPPIS